HVAKLLGLPVLLVVDASRAARSLAAVVLGCRTLDPDLRLIGVVLNNVGSESHASAATEPIEREAGLRSVPGALLDRATAQVTAHLDLDRLIQLARFTPTSTAASGLFPPEPERTRARLAVAQDEAFG